MKGVVSVSVVGAVFVAMFAEGSPLLRVRTVDDSGQGVKSKVRLILADSKSLSLGSTDDQGWLSAISQSCDQGRTIVVEPYDTVNYFNENKDCPLAGSQIRITKKSYYRVLRANAASLERLGENAKAALVYNELAERAAAFDPAQAAADRKKVLTLFLKATQGDATGLLAFDLQQNEVVLNDHGKAAVAGFQKANRLKSAKGTIDYNTLRSAAGADVAQYIFRIQGPPV